MDSFAGSHLADNRCFLCAANLTPASRTDEHVIPRWLQDQHDLWNRRLTLLNRTLIPYRQLQIPCCSVCNSGPLSQMENDIRGILSGQFRPLSDAEEFRLFQWCSKLLYGLLYREMSLQLERRDRSKGSIVQEDFLQGLLTFHHFMTSIHRPFRFESFTPYSIFTAEAATVAETQNNFDYIDWIVSGPSEDLRVNLFLALRVKNFAIFCVFQDNGLQKSEFQGQFDMFRGIPLQPIQFLEFACKAAYKHSRLAFQPRYNSSCLDSPLSEVTVTSISAPPRSGAWHDWIDHEYAHLFCSLAARRGYRGIPSPDEFYVGKQHHTWLFNGDGTPKRIPAGEGG